MTKISQRLKSFFGNSTRQGIRGKDESVKSYPEGSTRKRRQTVQLNGAEGVTLYRGYIGSRDVGYATRLSSTTDFSKLYAEQQSGKEVKIHTYDSNYADKVVWANTDPTHATVVAFSRFIAKLVADPEFKKACLEDPTRFVPSLIEFKVDPKDLFIFTEGSDEKIYPYQGNEQKVAEGHALVPKIDPSVSQIDLISDDKQKEFFGDGGYLFYRDYDINFRSVASMMFTCGFTDEEFDQRFNARADGNGIGEFRNSAGQDRNRPWFEVLTRAYIACLEKLAEGKTTTTKEQLEDLLSRGVSGFLYYFKYDKGEYFTITPEDVIEGKFKYVPLGLPPIDSRLENKLELLLKDVGQREGRLVNEHEDNLNNGSIEGGALLGKG